jgi:hypothetical protein
MFDSLILEIVFFFYTNRGVVGWRRRRWWCRFEFTGGKCGATDGACGVLMTNSVMDTIRMEFMLTWKTKEGIIGNIVLETQRAFSLIGIHRLNVLGSQDMWSNHQIELWIGLKKSRVVRVHAFCHGLLEHLVFNLSVLSPKTPQYTHQKKGRYPWDKDNFLIVFLFHDEH